MDQDSKEKILLKMDGELAVISSGNYDLCSGENYMTAESVHNAIRNWFADVQISNNMVSIIAQQDNPLERMYDFYVDSGGLTKEIYGDNFIKDYTKNLYHEYLRSRVHEKVKEEYEQFVLDFKEKRPYDIAKMITEMAVKIQVYSLFRYNDNFELSDINLEKLMTIDNILDKVYKNSNMKNIATNELADVEKTVVISLLNLGKVPDNLDQIEDEDYEMG